MSTYAQEAVSRYHQSYQRGLITLGELAEELARLDRRYGARLLGPWREES